jgi:hypothetical protein
MNPNYAADDYEVAMRDHSREQQRRLDRAAASADPKTADPELRRHLRALASMGANARCAPGCPCARTEG